MDEVVAQLNALVSEGRAWIERIASQIQAQPDLERFTPVLLLLIICNLLTLLLLFRRSRELREQVHQVKALQGQLAQRPAAKQEVLDSEVPATTNVAAVAGVVPGVAPTREGVQREPAASLVQGMTKSRGTLLERLKGFFGGGKRVQLGALDDLEEVLILSDVGARCAATLMADVRAVVQQEGALDEGALRRLLKAGVLRQLSAVSSDHRIYRPSGSPLVVMVVGVNGVGKTTTVAKLAARFSQQGKKVVMVAADTFRAAAVQQLAEWGRRLQVRVVCGAENAKPSTVVFDGMVAAQQEQADVVLIDTAGRLHTKSNLMQELEGIRNAIRKHVPDAPHETVLVVDGVSGQNALAQAREFNAAVQLSGVVVTKLDGTPKGGIVVAIAQELKIPVYYVGVGEKPEDLIPFSPQGFVDGLLGNGEGEIAVGPSTQVMSSGRQLVG